MAVQHSLATENCQGEWKLKTKTTKQNKHWKTERKYLEWKPANLRQVLNIPRGNPAASISRLCKIFIKAPAVPPHICFPPNLLFVPFSAFHLPYITFALTCVPCTEIVDLRLVQHSECMSAAQVLRIAVVLIIIPHCCLCLKSGMSGGWTRQAEHTQKPN